MTGEKKQLILTAALSIVNSGYRLEDVKMSDIAKAASIGKGTIYEYFDSKEQLFHEMRIYAMNCLSDDIMAAIQREDTLTQKVRSLVITLNNRTAENTMLFESVAKHDVPSLLTQSCILDTDKRDIALKWVSIADELTACALKQGIINAQPMQFKEHIAMVTLMVTTIMYSKNKSAYNDMTEEKMIAIMTENFGKMLS